MISWMDFVLDDVFGPSLRVSSGADEIRGGPLGVSVVMEDERPKQNDEKSSIQETSRNSRPARMVGDPGLDSVGSSSTDAVLNEPSGSSRYGGVG